VAPSTLSSLPPIAKRFIPKAVARMRKTRVWDETRRQYGRVLHRIYDGPGCLDSFRGGIS
jgi:hypothetical protein